MSEYVYPIVEVAFRCLEASHNTMANAKSGELENHSLGNSHNMINRLFESVSGVSVMINCGLFSQAEALCRVCLEPSVIIEYILSGDPEARMNSYFYSFLSDEKDRLRKWKNMAVHKFENEKSVIDDFIVRKELDLINLEDFLRRINGGSSTQNWPRSKFDLFKEVDREDEYRNFYSTLYSEIHFDAQETIRYFSSVVSKVHGVSADNLALEGVAHTIFMATYSARMFAEVAIKFCEKFSDRPEKDLHELTKSLNILNQALNYYQEAYNYYQFSNVPLPKGSN